MELAIHPDLLLQRVLVVIEGPDAKLALVIYGVTLADDPHLRKPCSGRWD